MDLVESSQRSFLKVGKVNFCLFFTWRPSYPKLFDQVFFILACSFPRRVLMDCQKMDLIESLYTKGHFSKIRNVRKRSNLGNLLLFGNFLKNDQITFLYFLHAVSWGWYWSTVKRWVWLKYWKGNFASCIMYILASCSLFVVKQILS